jgi:cell division protein ZapA (FtsZ GTPase activity inhibitor)
MRSYSWALSGDFNAKMDLFGEAQTEEDIDALADYVDITIKALKRSLKARGQEPSKTEN